MSTKRRRKAVRDDDGWEIVFIRDKVIPDGLPIAKPGLSPFSASTDRSSGKPPTRSTSTRSKRASRRKHGPR